MGIIIGLVFLGAFAVVVLLMMASGTRSAQRSKQMIAALDSALADAGPETRDVLLNIRKGETFSTIPWLNRKLLDVDFALQLRNLLHQADLKWTAGSLLLGCGACFAVSVFLLNFRFDSVLLSMLAALPIGFAPFGWVLLKRKNRFRSFERGLPGAMDLMVSALRAGHSLVAAMGFVANECPDPVGYEFKACCEEHKYGLELKIAMDNMLERVPLQDLRIIATAIMIQSESGGNLAEVLDKTSFVIRERFRLIRQISVHTAQGRLTGLILTFLPVVLGFALYTVNPDMMRLLWTTPVGVKLLWAAGIMVLIGGLIIRSIVNMDV